MFVVILVGIAVKHEDKGKIFYRQTRIGKNEKPFTMYKFRTMVEGADDMKVAIEHKNDVSGLMFKSKEDPRITKCGKFLRKHSIDEIPQFINVIKGDMNLIGPRPPLPEEVKEYNEYELQRLLVKPGCSGLWQVTYRNNVGFKEMVQIDLDYIKRQNILLDIAIFFKTIYVLIFPNGLYE